MRHAVGSFGGHKLELLERVDVGLLDLRKPVKVRDVGQDARVHEVGEGHVAADADDVGVVLADEARAQDGGGVVGAGDGHVDVVMGLVEEVLQLLEGLDGLLLVGDDLDLGLAGV